MKVFVNSLKYPRRSELSFQKGWTDTTVDLFSINSPNTHASEVLPVPEIPCIIMSLVTLSDAMNERITFIS